MLKLSKNLAEKYSNPRMTVPFFWFSGNLHLSVVTLKHPASQYIIVI